MRAWMYEPAGVRREEETYKTYLKQVGLRAISASYILRLVSLVNSQIIPLPCKLFLDMIFVSVPHNLLSMKLVPEKNR